MRFFDPHIHTTSRTTDDYEAMAAAGVRAIIEPAFWLGQPRTTLGAFTDYYASLIGWERFRAAQFGIKHYCAIGLNSKEANNEGLAREVPEPLPRYACKEGVVAIGEIGFDDQTAAEERCLGAQLELAKELDMPVMIHTPHRDKTRGTSRIMDICEEHGLAPSTVVIDHNNAPTLTQGGLQTIIDFCAAFINCDALATEARAKYKSQSKQRLYANQLWTNGEAMLKRLDPRSKI